MRQLELYRTICVDETLLEYFCSDNGVLGGLQPLATISNSARQMFSAGLSTQNIWNASVFVVPTINVKDQLTPMPSKSRFSETLLLTRLRGERGALLV